MRLAQLARKISVSPSQIIDLLAQEQLFFEDGSNAKLNDDVVRKVLLTLAPNRLSEITSGIARSGASCHVRAVLGGP